MKPHNVPKYSASLWHACKLLSRLDNSKTTEEWFENICSETNDDDEHESLKHTRKIYKRNRREVEREYGRMWREKQKLKVLRGD